MRKILDERERQQRQQHIRLIITETLMFLSVLVLVGFLTLVVMGYSFNLRGLDGSAEVVERTGLVQISSIPTGATIYIDGETGLLFNTNASRAVLSGEHEISLARGGFDGWQKTINVTEGMMYRLNYPRLFKEEREKEVALEFSESVGSATVSPNHERMMYVMGGKLYVANLNENVLATRELELTGLDGDVVKITTFTGAEWSGNSERVLAMVNGGWAVINVREPKATVWLGEIAEKNEAKMKSLRFASETGERVLMVNANKELVEWNVRGKRMSEALVSGVEAYDNDDEKVVFVTATQKDSKEEKSEDVAEAEATKRWQVRTYRVGDEESFLAMEASEKPIVRTMRYFQEVYVGVIEAGDFTVYRKTGWPVADGEMEEIFKEEVGFSVSDLKKRGKGMVFEIASEGSDAKVFDVEAMKTTTVDVTSCRWVDEYLRSRLVDGRLSVLDYDGLNERVLVQSGVLAGRVVTISGNNRWLYYFEKFEAKDDVTVEGDTNDAQAKPAVERLVRERII